MVPKVWFNVICPTINNVNMAKIKNNNSKDKDNISLIEYEKGYVNYTNCEDLIKYERGWS